MQRGARLALAGVMGAALVTGCAKPRVAEVYPQVSEYAGREIAELTFVDPEPFTADSLDTLTQTHETYCSLLGFLPFCFWGGRNVGRVEMRTLGEDLSRLGALYRQAGYFGTRVVPEFEEVAEDGGPVRLRLVVRRGDGIVVDSVVVEGTEGIADPDSLEAALPLQAGELLDLREFVASADTVLEALRRRGHAYAEVLRNYAVDTIQDRSTVWLLAVPGPRVTVDSIRIAGLGELGRTDVLRQLPFEPGELLRLRDLRAGQRNLYELELIQFASVALAPDSLQRAPGDSTTATVQVAITEAPEHVVESRVSYGSVECVGIRGQWTDRSVFGGGRKLTLYGSVSRVGVADPVTGLESICGRGEDREIATEVDFRVAADFVQPYFLSPRNQLTTTVFAERQSEPELYQRTALGARLGAVRRRTTRDLFTGALDLEFRRMVATPLLYCFELRVCDQADAAPFEEGRWRNALTGGWLRDRGNRTVNPTGGHVLRGSGMWSTGLLGSDYDFLRANLEASLYRTLRPGWVVAGGLRLGSFLTRAGLGGAALIPPEERFFAGGASSVRGFGRARLGPGLYVVDNDELQPEAVTDAAIDSLRLPVEFFPTGGTSVAVASIEGRFPSPFLGDVLRLAVFVDAGTVGLDPVWQLDSEWRVTPGAGLRIATPVGPVRVDLGYNPYPRNAGRLFAEDPDTGELVRIRDEYEPEAPALLSLRRFTLHIAVGQAF